MRILHILKSIDNVGNGVINAAIDLIYFQAQESSLEVGVASCGGEYQDLLEKVGVKHFTLQQSGFLNSLKSPLTFRKIIRDFDPDIVHIHMTPGIILATLFRFQTRYALVSVVQSEFQRNAILMGFADLMIVITKAVGDLMVNRGVPRHKVRVVLSGTLGSPRVLSQEELKAAPLHRPSITTVAGMFVRKGINELIDAFTVVGAEIQDAHLYLVGNGTDIDDFKTQAASSPIADRIHFEGFQPEPQRYLMATDIFVLASHKEPFGLVITEAREAGCAVIGSDIDGIPEALSHGKGGILVPSKNSSALAIAILGLLRNPEELQTWKQNAKINLEHFQVKRICQETLAVYHELLANKQYSTNKKQSQK
jgi:glycosyltransferase involved in cell wall biosynthesis